MAGAQTLRGRILAGSLLPEPKTSLKCSITSLLLVKNQNFRGKKMTFAHSSRIIRCGYVGLTLCGAGPLYSLDSVLLFSLAVQPWCSALVFNLGDQPFCSALLFSHTEADAGAKGASGLTEAVADAKGPSDLGYC